MGVPGRVEHHAGMERTERTWAGNEPKRLRVYDIALHLADQVHEVFRRAQCPISLIDQAQRAADSIVLNIAEGSAHRSPGQKARHYQIAHASAGECMACLDLLQRRDPRAFVSPARRNAQIVSRMLHALINEWQHRK
jgi:four helix bundle protein